MVLSVVSWLAVRPGRLVGEVAVQLADLEAERASRRKRVAGEALRLARNLPGLGAHLNGLATDHARGLGLLGVPLIGVAGPAAIVVAHEQARLDQLAAEREIFDQHAAIGKVKIVVAVDGDTLPVGQRQPACLDGVIGKERCVGRVRNQPAHGLRGIAGDATRLRELGGNGAAAARGLHDLVQRAAQVNHVQLAVGVLCE